MFEVLEKLRQKPVAARKRIAFLSAVSVALVMLGIWGTVVYPDFSKTQSQQANAAPLGPSPLSTFGDTLSNAASAIGSQFGELKDTVSSLASTSVVNTSTSTSSTTEY